MSTAPMIQRDLQTQLGVAMRANHARIATLARPLDPDRLTRRPSPGAWSVAEVLDHLRLMDALFIPVVETRLRVARPDAAAPLREWRPSLVGKLIVGSLEKPKPLLAPKAGRPGTPRAGIVERFIEQDARYLSLMEAASSFDWRGVRFAPPVAPWVPLRMNLGDAFRVHEVHVRRHIGQIERVVAEI